MSSYLENAMDQCAFLNTLANAQSLEELWPLHCEKMADYGFDRLIYGLTNFRIGDSLGDPEDFVILSNHAPDYLDWFIGEQMYLHAPMVNWALQNDGVASWRRIDEIVQRKTLSAKEQETIEHNRQAGVHAGYTISFNSTSQRSKGAIALTARQEMTQSDADEIWRSHGEEIEAFNNMLHLKILSLPRNTPARELTKRQLEALHWIGDGKTTADTATLMGLTQATVEKHLRLAREVLCVETTAQAVLKAALQNQMYIGEF